ncbi:MAG: LCP family protein [Janthinobacterium lividum]
MSKGKKIALWSVLSVFILLIGGAGFLLHTYGRMIREPGGGINIPGLIGKVRETVFAPKEGFPGEDKLTIVCMGIDDSWTNSDVVYTSQSRTDTLFVMTLDLVNHKATMLSIPRDTYTHIAGTDIHTKINAAYATGGPDRTVATVNEFLGTNATHYLVLNIDATKKMVDALGGVDVDVEHPMHYHDAWGHLSIDLQPGQQHLDGNNAVGFARYRHPDAGKHPTPEDGDERRMYRQHLLLRAMVDRAKSFANITQAPHLADVAMSTVRTDFTRQQLLDIAAIFKDVQQDHIKTASLPGTDFRGPGGAWDYQIKPEVAHAYADWLIKGDQAASRPLTSVIIKNGTTTPGLAQYAVNQLKAQGYTDVRNGGNAASARVHFASSEMPAKPEIAQTVMLDTGVPNPDAPQDLSILLDVEDPKTSRQPVKPNKMGWTPPPALIVTLGQDYAAAVKANGGLNRDLATSSGGNGSTSAN